jgi:hypothetical protein
MPRKPPVATTSIWFAIICIALQARALAHSFPNPDDPEFRMEVAAAEFSSARNAALDSGVSITTISAAESVYSSRLLWPQSPGGAMVTACFWNGPPVVQQQVIDSDGAWEGFAGISLNFKDQSGKVRTCAGPLSADIRIALDSDDARLSGDYNPKDRPANGFWSLVGMQANDTPPGRPGYRPVTLVTL